MRACLVCISLRQERCLVGFLLVVGTYADPVGRHGQTGACITLVWGCNLDHRSRRTFGSHLKGVDLGWVKPRNSKDAW
jgi:hypothetical protein